MSAEQAKVTILVDNTANLDLVREHGLSLWIQAKDRTILFDSDQGAALRFNLDALGVCLKTARL